MSDVFCPYCNAPQDINHDDNYGYDEDEIYHQYCGDCDKQFTYTTHILLHYEVAKADCLNGEDHDFQPTCTVPIEATKMCCGACGEERRPTDEEFKQIMAGMKR